ncbi:MAG TPA: phosphoglucosamine mutase [Acidimicrobiales bacterium]|nr:phosphoglucosamine mutase [Acidimicrobiales bacterium]
MSLRFGTDGVRGAAGSELSPELVLALGRAAAAVLGGSEFVVGRDTRLSGPMLQAALSAGIAAEGLDVVDIGVAPTPAVAAVAAARGVAAAVISASHNPYHDNGIKLLAPGGLKLNDDEEQQIERAVAARSAVASGAPPAIGRLRSDDEAIPWYCRRVVDSLGGRRVDGIRVVVDCANGAATPTAERILAQAGADVVHVIAAQPDGTNINERCGSTDPSLLAESVRAHGADVGLALDGDADRVLAVDEHGEIVDGDRLLAMFAVDLRERDRLAGNTLVVTVMSNLGLQKAMEDAGVRVHRTAVGDRNVLEALDGNGWSLGGEQSGHIIFRELATTGDGVLSGLLLLDLLRRSGRKLSELAAESMVSMPQVLRNVEIPPGSPPISDSARLSNEIRAVEDELGTGGRVVLRASGTEPLVRVMVEAQTEHAAASAAQRLVDAVEEAARG